MSIDKRFEEIDNTTNKINNLIKKKNWTKLLKKNGTNQGKNGLIYTIDDIDCVVKIIPLEKDAFQTQHSLKFSTWRELTSLRWINQLVKQKISPNFFVLYSFKILEDCSKYFIEKKSYGCIVLFLEKADGTLYEWIKQSIDRKEKITSPLWLSALFQIFSGIYAVQHKYGLIHRDLHWKNILYKKVEPRGHWIYYLKKIPYYVPCLGYRFGICDFGKSMRRQDAFLSENVKKKYSGKSSHIFIQGDDEKWRDWYIYQSQKLVEDLHRISHLPRWISDEYLGDVMPEDIKDLLKKIQVEWTTDKFLLPGEIIMLSMGIYLDPRIGQVYIDNFDLTYTNFIVGELVVFNGKIAMIAIIYSNLCKLIISSNKMKEVDIKNIKKPTTLPKNPITNIIGIFHLD